MTGNIICNNCLGSRIYEVNGKRYGNPFQWCVIRPLDMLFLIEEYENINFSRHFLTTGKLNGAEYFKTSVDGVLDIWWVHHFKDETYGAPTKVENHQLRNADLRYSKMDEYLSETYERRLERMVEKPTFIVNFDNWWGMYDNDVVKIGKTTKKKDDVILVSSTNECDALECQLSVVLPFAMDYDVVANELYNNGYFRL